MSPLFFYEKEMITSDDASKQVFQMQFYCGYRGYCRQISFFAVQWLQDYCAGLIILKIK